VVVNQNRAVSTVAAPVLVQLIGLTLWTPRHSHDPHRSVTPRPYGGRCTGVLR